jgi:exodeoxyribonuclease VII large subunit
MEKKQYLNVTEVIEQVKGVVKNNFHFVSVQGEIVNWSKAHSGHCYFSLSDGSSSINCALFRNQARFIKDLASFKDGAKVNLVGELTVYTLRANLQIIAHTIELANQKGTYQVEFERIKNKLRNEGLFDLEIKKEIPKNPRKIAVITSPKGAAVQDFLKIMMRRSENYNIVIIPTLVQGKGAESSLLESMNRAQSLKGVDVIVLTRGGGSLEDLWAFNSEELARTIHASKIPVISAIGHEINFSISDFVADHRSETPSAAAEFLTRAEQDFLTRFKNLKSQLGKLRNTLLSEQRFRLQNFSPKLVTNLLWQRIQNSSKKLNSLGPNNFFSINHINEKYFYLDELYKKNFDNLKLRLNQKKEQTSYLNGKIDSLDPKKVLTRGYTYLQYKGKIVHSRKDFLVSEPKSFSIQFFDGPIEINRDV